ncbi:MAG: RnfH family protein [Acidiferrobacterales bacterium]
MNVADQANTISVEVAYATPKRQAIFSVCIAKGATVEKTIQLSGILQSFPEIDLSIDAVGIFGERVDLADIVEGGDRIEIYRPLVNDPKETRRRRVEHEESS